MNNQGRAAWVIGWTLSAPMVMTAAAAEPDSVIVCHSPTATREIRTYLAANGGCRVDYVKDNVARTLWSAATDRAYCATRASALAGKLARGNFQCTAAGATRAAAPSPVAQEAVQKPAPESPDLTAAQIVAANQWLQRRVDGLSKNEAIHAGPEAKRYTQKPDFLAAADLDADGKIDLVLAWGWSSFRCDGTYLTVLINDASNAQPSYRAAEVQLPSHCGAKGWLSSVKDVEARRIHIELQQRYPGSNNMQQISATLRHDGTFSFFGPGGRPGSLASIEKALPMKFD